METMSPQITLRLQDLQHIKYKSIIDSTISLFSVHEVLFSKDNIRFSSDICDITNVVFYNISSEVGVKSVTSLAISVGSVIIESIKLHFAPDIVITCGNDKLSIPIYTRVDSIDDCIMPSMIPLSKADSRDETINRINTNKIETHIYVVETSCTADEQYCCNGNTEVKHWLIFGVVSLS